MIKRGLPTSEYRLTVFKTTTFHFFYNGENFGVIMNHVISNIAYYGALNIRRILDSNLWIMFRFEIEAESHNWIQ